MFVINFLERLNDKDSLPMFDLNQKQLNCFFLHHKQNSGNNVLVRTLNTNSFFFLFSHYICLAQDLNANTENVQVAFPDINNLRNNIKMFF